MGASDSRAPSFSGSTAAAATTTTNGDGAPQTPHHHPHQHDEGAGGRHLSRDLDCYAIRLEAHQSLRLYGYFVPKRTLTWRDVQDHARITLSVCVECGLPGAKLHRMQPDIKVWIRSGKATVNDCEHMGPWRPNPFTDLGCSIGDLVVFRRALPPRMLIESGVTFDELRDRYGLTVELMLFLKYPTDDWITLGMEEAFVEQLPPHMWKGLFGMMTRAELSAQIRKCRQRRQLQEQ